MKRQASKKNPTSIGLKKAIEAMSRSGARMVLMRNEKAIDGFAYYVVPGGHVDVEVAEKIKRHPDVIAGEDGLFPGHDQTWRMGA